MLLFLQVGLAKLNASGGATKGVMGQDLVIGMGDPIQTGDSIEVKYTGWLYQNKSFGNVSATSDGRVFFFCFFFYQNFMCCIFGFQLLFGILELKKCSGTGSVCNEDTVIYILHQQCIQCYFVFLEI